MNRSTNNSQESSINESGLHQTQTNDSVSELSSKMQRDAEERNTRP
jgi:hypothetical protein